MPIEVTKEARMSRVSYYEILLASLAGDYPQFSGMVSISPEEAYQLLQQRTGQDFGFDIKAWEKWLDENKEDWRVATRPHSRMSFIEQTQDLVSSLVLAAVEYIKDRWS
jgi:hypothetical protein